VKKLYSQKEVSRLLSISENQIRYWDRIGLITHIEKEQGQLLFDFKRLVAFRTVKRLLDSKIPLRRIRTCMERLKKILPETEHPLSEIRIFVQGDQLVLCKDNLKLTPNGQLLIDFEENRPPLIPLPVDPVEELFFQALDDEEEERWEEARRKYETILTLMPDHVDSFVNIGNSLYRTGLAEGAEEFYRKALLINPDHVEANYNLANLLEERNDLENAILLYRKALHEDPEFADAHFNLARAFEKAGNMEEAIEHWQRYLDLDSFSEWANCAKRRLNPPRLP
jgi:tetratricopeptide (TPR) repeat protein